LLYEGKLNKEGWPQYFPLLAANTSDAWLEDFVTKARALMSRYTFEYRGAEYANVK